MSGHHNLSNVKGSINHRKYSSKQNEYIHQSISKVLGDIKLSKNSIKRLTVTPYTNKTINEKIITEDENEFNLDSECSAPLNSARSLKKTFNKTSRGETSPCKISLKSPLSRKKKMFTSIGPMDVNRMSFGTFSPQNKINHKRKITDPSQSMEKKNYNFMNRSNSISPTKFQKRLSFCPIENKNENNYNKNILRKKSTLVEKTIQFQVAARFRPFNKVEIELSNGVDLKNYNCIEYINEFKIKVRNSYMGTSSEIILDNFFPPETTQEKIFNSVARETINEVLDGYNGTIFAYGQSGSGKTFTMFGTNIFNNELKGIIPRSIDHIFNYIQNDRNIDTKYEIKFSLVELYKESIYDLLSPEKKPSELKIKEHPEKGIFIQNLTEEYITSPEEFLLLLEEAEKYRAVSETLLNLNSSRSHLIFIVEISQKTLETEKKGILNLIDLAGSEKVSKTGAIGETLEEAKKINLSLSTLGNVINALNSCSQKDFVPYRESKLTRILQDSLCGNFRTTLIVTCTPHYINLEETLSTLNFGQRARKLRNNIRANIKTPNELAGLVNKLTKELNRAKNEINNIKNMNNFTKTRNKLQEENVKNSNDINSDEDNIQNSINLFNNTSSNGEIFEGKFLSKLKKVEISDLKKEIEILKKENKDLNYKISIYIKESKLEKYIKDLEELVKFNICELTKLKTNHMVGLNDSISQENIMLKLHFEELRKETSEMIKKFEYFNSLLMNDENVYLSNDNKNLSNNLNNFHKKLENFTVKRTSDNPNVSLLTSYKSIILQNKFFVRTILDDFLNKEDYFKTARNSFVNSNDTNTNNKNQINNNLCRFENEKYLKLKNSYVNLCMINTYYEKIVLDILNKAIFDIQKFEREIQWKDKYFYKIDKFIEIMNNYFEVLSEIKILKNSEHVDDVSIPKRSNIIKKISKNSSTLLSNLKNKMNMSNNQIFNTLRDKYDDIFSRTNTSQDDPNNVDYGNNKKYRTLTKERLGTLEDPDDNNLYNRNKYHTLHPLSEKDCTFNRFDKSVFCKFDFAELKTAQNEATMFKNFIDYLIQDNQLLKEKCSVIDKSVVDYQERYRKIYENQIESYSMSLKTLKNFYEDELIGRRDIIENLCKTIDDMFLNKGIVADKNKKKLFEQFYKRMKMSILNHEVDPLKNTINKVTDSYLKETGSATKKMDYIVFRLNDYQSTNNVKIDFGSGLNSNFPGRSPLNRNLKKPLKGDDSINS